MPASHSKYSATHHWALLLNRYAPPTSYGTESGNWSVRTSVNGRHTCSFQLRIPSIQSPIQLRCILLCRQRCRIFELILDRFSQLEIKYLVQHGYQVARKICKSLFSFDNGGVPTNPPWDPYGERTGETTSEVAEDRDSLLSSMRRAEGYTRDARELRQSAERRVWSTLVDFGDWPTYVYVVALLLLLVVLP